MDNRLKGENMLYTIKKIAKIKENNEIVKVVSEHMNLKKNGDNYIGFCPFHEDTMPLLLVDKIRQTFKCLGCGTDGDVIDFIEQFMRIPYIDAVKYLSKRGKVSPPKKSIDKEAEIKKKIYEINEKAASYFNRKLKSSAGVDALKYLNERKITEDTIKTFKIGCTDKFGSLLYKYLKACKYDDDILSMSGLISYNEDGKAYDKFRDRVMFPIVNINNKIIGFGGRILGDEKPKYLNSPETMVFDKGRNLFGLNTACKSAAKSGILLCEGFVDVVTMHQAGFNNAVASLGTALTENQVHLLRNYTNKVHIVYDSDAAGVNATFKAIKLFEAENFTIKVMDLTPYKDPDEFIKELGSAAFQQRIDNASTSLVFEYEYFNKNRSTYSIDEIEKTVGNLMNGFLKTLK